jgi:hypothetical protein
MMAANRTQYMSGLFNNAENMPLPKRAAPLSIYLLM